MAILVGGPQRCGEDSEAGEAVIMAAQHFPGEWSGDGQRLAERGSRWRLAGTCVEGPADGAVGSCVCV